MTIQFNKEDYTTHQLSELTGYTSKKGLLHALYNNQKNEPKNKDPFLLTIWKNSYKRGGKRLYKKEEIDRLLGRGK